VETAIRITRRWQQSGLVQLSRGQIVLRNINDLRRVALLNSGSPLT
jgi:hypothetical protein